MRIRLTRPQLLLVAAATLAAPAIPLTQVAGAQAYFGQNQVQFKKFTWKVIKTDHFEVHYYSEIETAAHMVARMAERSYARLSRLLNYQFKERKPIVLFASRGDFAQNNVTGDLGEGTGGATDALRQRNMFFFGQDMAEAEHVLTHEMVHQFQYDVQFRGRTGASVMAADMAGASPPLWFIEGMAEYLSIGPDHPATDAIVRDAALNGSIPSVEQMTEQPERWFPYRYGESFWRFIGARWGDEMVGEILQGAMSSGVDRAFKRFTGFELEDLGEEWKEAIQTQYLPSVATLDRPRKFAQPMLNSRRTKAIIPVYVAPALSNDGRQIAYISTGSLLRAEVFLDLYLADATTGKRLKRLTNSTLNPETEELRYAYSQSAFSPDGRQLAYTAQTGGKDVLFLLDVRSRRVVRKLDTNLDQMIGPTFSPDGKRIIFSGARGGFTNLYVIDTDGNNLRALTTDLFGAVMPTWSPDGRKVAFVSGRGPKTDLALLKFSKWQINILDLDANSIETIPGQDGKNLNPQWAPDGKSVAFISDRTGIAQLFLYDFDAKEHYQLTKLVGGISSVTENSPAMTWARQADKLAFVYMDNGDYTIWAVTNPRQLRKEAFVTAPVATVAGVCRVRCHPVRARLPTRRPRPAPMPPWPCSRWPRRASKPPLTPHSAAASRSIAQGLVSVSLPRYRPPAHRDRPTRCQWPPCSTASRWRFRQNPRSKASRIRPRSGPSTSRDHRSAIPKRTTDVVSTAARRSSSATYWATGNSLSRGASTAGSKKPRRSLPTRTRRAVSTGPWERFSSPISFLATTRRPRLGGMASPCSRRHSSATSYAKHSGSQPTH